MSAIVLVADQDPFNLRMLQEVCEAAGYEVVSAADGPEVLAMVARQPPDLLVLDANMPMMDGFEILRILKADADLQEIPVVLVTDVDDAESRSRGIQLGAEDYLTKPYRVFEIQQRIRNMLRATKQSRIGLHTTTPPADQRDPVTGAGTPSQLLISIDYEHTRAVRYDHPLTCMVVQVANMAELLEYGEGGNADSALAALGNGLRQCIRAVDHLFRLKRDEFCVLLPETDAKGAQIVVDRIRQQVQSGELWGEELDPFPSLQIALASTPSPDIRGGEDLLAVARKSLMRRSHAPSA